MAQTAQTRYDQKVTQYQMGSLSRWYRRVLNPQPRPLMLREAMAWNIIQKNRTPMARNKQATMIHT